MNKMARKPSSDPLQEELRQTKAVWNKEVSAFIDDLISFKKIMNGHSSKFHPEKGTIKDPIPSDPATIIGVLINDFNDIAQKCNSIIANQIEYSSKRRKKQVRSPESSSAGTDLASKLSNSNYELVSQASNPITRFFTKLFNPPIGWGSAADLRRARVAMLNACADSFNRLEKFQVLIVKSSPQSITDAHKKLEEASHFWNLMSRSFLIFKSSKSVDAKDTGGKIEPENQKEFEKSLNNNGDDIKMDRPPEHIPDEPKKESLDLSILGKRKRDELLVQDVIENIDELKFKIDPNILNNLRVACEQFLLSGGENYDPNLSLIYFATLKKIKKLLGEFNVGSFADFGKIFREKEMARLLKAPSTKEELDQEAVRQKAEDEAKQDAKQDVKVAFDKTSQDFLKKWLGMKRHELKLFDKTSPMRMAAYNEAEEIRESLNELMDLLEDGLDEQLINPYIKSINAKFVTVRSLVSSLHLSGKNK